MCYLSILPSVSWVASGRPAQVGHSPCMHSDSIEARFMPRIRQAAGLVLLTRMAPQHLLLLKHKSRWDLPKGHVDPGEELISAALRETEEETGIDAQAIELDPVFEFRVAYDVQHKKHGFYHKQVFYYLGYIERICDIHLTEHLDYRWWPWPPEESIQPETIDPLLAAVREHVAS